MLQISDLHAEIDGTPILNGLNLEVGAGEVHAIMGPNGAGKSTLGYVLGGRPGYEITGGAVRFMGEDLLAMDAHERAAAGLFLGFQYPVEIPGISNLQFLREALNAQRRERGEEPLSGGAFMKIAKAQAALLGLEMDMLKRPVNVGFSGGEKKRNEMVQMGILGPAFAVLDETDSGLDIDALRVVGEGINAIMRPGWQARAEANVETEAEGADNIEPDAASTAPASGKAVLLITHYQRLLDYVTPDYVHILAQGKIVKSGGPGLALWLEQEGYDGVIAEAAQ